MMPSVLSIQKSCQGLTLDAGSNAPSTNGIQSGRGGGGASAKEFDLIQALNPCREIRRRTKGPFGAWLPMSLCGCPHSVFDSLPPIRTILHTCCLCCSRSPTLLSPQSLVTGTCLAMSRFGMHRLRGSLRGVWGEFTFLYPL